MSTSSATTSFRRFFFLFFLYGSVSIRFFISLFRSKVLFNDLFLHLQLPLSSFSSWIERLAWTLGQKWFASFSWEAVQRCQLLFLLLSDKSLIGSFPFVRQQSQLYFLMLFLCLVLFLYYFSMLSIDFLKDLLTVLFCLWVALVSRCSTMSTTFPFINFSMCMVLWISKHILTLSILWHCLKTSLLKLIKKLPLPGQ